LGPGPDEVAQSGLKADADNHLEKRIRKKANIIVLLNPRKTNFIIKSITKQSKSANSMLLLNLLVSLHLSILLLTSHA